ncbi:MAG: hypothetical protein KDD69_14275 [Bdellovibrionales bacterium]|nr:hypothetical protein [Bdellovibrionales bacterium]
MELTQYITEKHVGGALRARLETLEAAERECIERVVCGLNPSANTLRALMGLAEEIGARDGMSLVEVFSSPEVTAALVEQAPRKVRQKRVREVLHARRYPEIHAIKARLQQARQQVLVDCGLTLELPEDLEGDAIQVSLTVRSAEELARAAERMQQAANHPSTTTVFSILKGEY